MVIAGTTVHSEHCVLGSGLRTYLARDQEEIVV